MVGYSEGVFESIKFIHIVGAIVWIGSGLYFQFQGARLIRAQDPARVAVFAKDVEFAGTRLLMPASAIVLIAGIAMVLYSPVYNFSDAWIWLSLVGFAATFVTGAFFLGPAAGKLGTAIEVEGPESPVAQGLIRRIFSISRIDQFVLVVVVADMVFKPGS